MFAVVRVGRVGFLTCFFFSCAAGAQEAQSPAEGSTPHGTVLFDKDQNAAPVEKKPDGAAAQPVVAFTDAERASLIFTAYDLDVHLVPARSQIAVLASFRRRTPEP